MRAAVGQVWPSGLLSVAPFKVIEPVAFRLSPALALKVPPPPRVPAVQVNKLVRSKLWPLAMLIVPPVKLSAGIVTELVK